VKALLIDTHAHLDDKRFDGDREEVINRCVEEGVVCIINAGSDLSSSIKAISLAEKHSIIYAAVGIHPHEAKTADKNTTELLRSLAGKEKVVAIGETGLDYHYDFSPREKQKEVFRQQIALAREMKLPIVVHDRESHGDILQILKEEKAWEVGGVMHCFSGSRETAKECMDMNFFISFAGPVTFDNARRAKEVAAYVPLDRLLTETDCPYLTPVPFRGKRNYPGYVKYVAEEICRIKDLDPGRLAECVLENTARLFGIDSRHYLS
jgi:TatD DNase family protein